MKPEAERLQRLMEKARRGRPLAQAEADPVPPPGFGTRLAARWASSRKSRSAADAWELLARWGSACATVICLVALIYQHQAATPATSLDLLLELPETENSF